MNRTPALLLPLVALVLVWVWALCAREEGETASGSSPATAKTAAEAGFGPRAETLPPPSRRETAVREAMDEAPVAAVRRAPLVVRGTVRDEEGGLVRDARVSLRLRSSGTETTALGVIAAPRGVFEASVEVPAAALEGRGAVTELLADASAPLHFRCRPLARDLFTAGEAVTFDLVLGRGAAVRGRVVDSSGRGVERARVFLREGDWNDDVRTSTDGRYELLIFEPGQCTVQAAHPERGQSDALTLWIDPAADCRAPDLRIRDGGTLAGTTHYPDDSVARGVHLYALPEEESRDDWWRDAGWRARVYWMWGGTGLRRGETISDERGNFRFAGLQAGRYFLVGGQPGRGAWSSLELFATGAEGIEVVVERYRLRLRTTDPAGHPIPGARFTWSVGTENESTGSSGWTRGPEGTAYLDGFDRIRPGATASAVAWTPSSNRAHAEREIVEGVWETRLDLVLEEPADLATLVVEVATSDGVPLERCQLHIDRVGEFRPQHELELSSETPARLQLPAGRYRLIASTLKPQLHHAPGEASFELHPGEVRPVRVVLPATGTLLVRVHRPPGWERVRLTSVQLYELPTPGDPPGTEAKPTLSDRFESTYRSECRDRGDPGEPFELTPFCLLETGPHRLELEFPGCAPVSCVVEIRPGETEDLELWLEAR